MMAFCQTENGMNVYDGNENYIFISYAHKDSETVVPILEALQTNGFRLWYDLGIEAGTEWPEYIAEHLEGCHTVIAFMSDHAASSRNCRNEINEALHLQKDMLVIHLSETQLTPGMRLQLNSTQSMFYYHHKTMNSFLTELFKARILQDCRCQDAQSNLPEDDREIVVKKAEPKAQARPTVDDSVPHLGGTIKEENLTAAQLYEVGNTYVHGISVAKDVEEAERWYRLAAQKGSAEAQNALGNFYYKGISVAKDYAKALEWYRSAIETNGLPAAYFNVGKCYLLGYGVEKDYMAALRCFGKVALKFGRVAWSFLKWAGGKLWNYGKRLVAKIKEALN